MLCRIDELKNKQVVCVENGCVLGFVSDIEMDTESGNLTSVIVFGKLRFWGLFGRSEDIVIPWSEITVIGSETILVSGKISELFDKNSKNYR